MNPSQARDVELVPRAQEEQRKQALMEATQRLKDRVLPPTTPWRSA